MVLVFSTSSLMILSTSKWMSKEYVFRRLLLPKYLVLYLASHFCQWWKTRWVWCSLLNRDLFFFSQGEFYNRGEKIDSSRFAADPGLQTQASTGVKESQNGEISRSRAYRCKKCRRIVALQENVVDHVPGEGESSFDWHKRRGGNPFSKSDEIDCSSIFVEPLRWMTAGETWKY